MLYNLQKEKKVLRRFKKLFADKRTKYDKSLALHREYRQVLQSMLDISKMAAKNKSSPCDQNNGF